MKPLHFLITAGPTREHFDPIRFVSNRSSGKMGYAIARVAAKLGKVTLVSGPTALQPPAGVDFVPVLSAAEMAKAVFTRFHKTDIVIMCAAVCDYRPRQVAARKLKKSGKKFVLELAPTTDILLELGRRKAQLTGRRGSRRGIGQPSSQSTARREPRLPILVGFAAETNNVKHYAQDKLRRKNLDLIVANDTRAFEGDTNIVTLIHRDGKIERLPEMPKARVARALVKRVLAIADRV